MKFIIPILLLLFRQTLLCQNYAATIKSDADRMNIAYVTGDINTLMQFTYPGVFEAVGDWNTIVTLTTGAWEQMQNEGYLLDTAYIGLPGEVYQGGDELFALIVQSIYSTFPGGTLKNDVPLLAVSRDEGKSWYFLDLRNIGDGLFKQLFPDFNYDLVILPMPPPVVITSTTIEDN